MEDSGEFKNNGDGASNSFSKNGLHVGYEDDDQVWSDACPASGGS